MPDIVGRRYAKALFELSKENNSVDKISRALGELAVNLESSAELRELVNSPLYSREDKAAAIQAITSKSKFDKTLSSTIAVMTRNGRLDALPSVIEAYNELVNAENDELVAEVTSAKKLTAAQKKKLTSVLKSKMGKDVAIKELVDPDILGGLVVSIGSTMIDNSLKAKLSKLHNTMKEVG